MWRRVVMTIGLVGLALPSSAAAAQFEAVGPTVSALAPAGDVNGDGYDDLIAGLLVATGPHAPSVGLLFHRVRLDALAPGEGFTIRGGDRTGTVVAAPAT